MHVINLATQALLGTYSKAEHFTPENESLHDVEVTGYIRDEVGLIRGITVKVRVMEVLFLYDVLLIYQLSKGPLFIEAQGTSLRHPD